MGFRQGEIRPGSLSTRVLHHLRAAPGPMTRLALAKVFPKDRDNLGRALDRLVRSGFVAQDEADRYGPDSGNGIASRKVEAHRDLTVPAALIAQLACIIARAHAYRRAGAPSMGALLLERAAERRLPEHIRQDLLALASLFAAHRQTFADFEHKQVAA